MKWRRSLLSKGKALIKVLAALSTKTFVGFASGIKNSACTSGWLMISSTQHCAEPLSVPVARQDQNVVIFWMVDFDRIEVPSTMMMMMPAIMCYIVDVQLQIQSPEAVFDIRHWHSRRILWAAQVRKLVPCGLTSATPICSMTIASFNSQDDLPRAFLQ